MVFVTMFNGRDRRLRDVNVPRESIVPLGAIGRRIDGVLTYARYFGFSLTNTGRIVLFLGVYRSGPVCGTR